MEPTKHLDGSLTVAELTSETIGYAHTTLGKTTIADLGARLRQIQGLKPGSSSIRTPEMIEEILERLRCGEALTVILLDPHLPAVSTIYLWMDKDEELDRLISRAQAVGQRTLADLRVHIAMGGEFSTGDARRDELLIKAINTNISQRNQTEFGEQSRVTVTHSVAPVVLPPMFLPKRAEKSPEDQS